MLILGSRSLPASRSSENRKEQTLAKMSHALQLMDAFTWLLWPSRTHHGCTIDLHEHMALLAGKDAPQNPKAGAQ